MNENILFGKKFKTLMAADFAVMNGAMVVPRCFKKLSDGAKGFWLGVQAVTLLIWAVWLVTCMIRKESPFPGGD